MDPIQIARDILRTTLQLGQRADSLVPASTLIGALPELNSLTIVGIVAAIEEQLGVSVADGEITAEMFATLDSLASFIAKKLA